ncbi:MAG: hypothetical protein E7650_03070 [Ruminococcaceae bacterium]|nr:hypothetical protein [Oscillospiraceae bacterium]
MRTSTTNSRDKRRRAALLRKTDLAVRQYGFARFFTVRLARLASILNEATVSTTNSRDKWRRAALLRKTDLAVH